MSILLRFVWLVGCFCFGGVLGLIVGWCIMAFVVWVFDVDGVR